MGAEAYPLAWPEGWPVTPINGRVDGKGHFGKMEQKAGHTWQSRRPLTFVEARQSLLSSLDKIGARQVTISTNFELNQSGLPRGDRRRPVDEAVAVYFVRKGLPIAMARDKYQRVEENMRSLGMALEAMAQLERHGGSGLAGRAYRGFVALPAPKRPHEVLGVPVDADETSIRKAWRARIAAAHPDQTGTHDAAAEINAARDEMLRRRG